MAARSSKSIDDVYQEYLAEKSPLSFVGWLIKSAIDSDPEFLAKAANLAASRDDG